MAASRVRCRGSRVPNSVLMTIDLPSVFLSTPFIVQPLPSQKSTWGQGVATASFHATTAWAMAVGMTIPGSVDGVAPGLGVAVGAGVGVGVTTVGPVLVSRMRSISRSPSSHGAPVTLHVHVAAV